MTMEVPVKKRREFTASECAFAWLSLLAGYAFCRAFPLSHYTLGGFLFGAALYAITLIVLCARGRRPGAVSLTVAVSGLVALSGLLRSGNEPIRALCALYSGAAYCLFVHTAGGNALEEGFTSLLLPDFARALFVQPFRSFGLLFPALGGRRHKDGSHAAVKILLGAAVAVVPTGIALALLSYDSGFVDLLRKLLRFDFWDVADHLLSLSLGVPVAMYLFGALYSSVDGRGRVENRAEAYHEVARKARVAPALTAIAAVVPVLALYALFFVSQWKYYVSGFVGVLPNEASYAEYARSGFFELCVVAVLNLALIVAVRLFLRRADAETSPVLRILSGILSLFTLVLMSTAMAKLVLYIDHYGMTPRRIYAAWFMLTLAAIFLLVLIKQIFPRLRLMPLCMAAAVAMLCALALADTDCMIADYNVDRYLSGDLAEMDLDPLLRNDSCVPAVARLARALEAEQEESIPECALRLREEWVDGSVYENAVWWLDEQWRWKDEEFFSFSAPRAKAHKALEELNLPAPNARPVVER